MLNRYVSFVAQWALPEATYGGGIYPITQLVDWGEGGGTLHAFVLHR